MTTKGTQMHQEWMGLIESALARREKLFSTLHAEETTCYRLFHGTTEGIPGLAIDRYGTCILVQTWRDPIEFGLVENIGKLVCELLGEGLVPVWNHRGKRGSVEYLLQPTVMEEHVGTELGVQYDVSPRHKGIDPLLFLDMRTGRRKLMEAAAGLSVLNLFSYTCGLGIAANLGGAKEVLNVDFSANALQVAERNAAMNGIDKRFTLLHEDAIPVMRQFAGLGVKGRARKRKHTRLQKRSFDLVVLDPPRYAKSPFGLVDTVGDYQSLFKPALLCTREGGSMLVSNNVASVDMEQWTDSLVRCALKAGRKIKNVQRLKIEDDFPSFDGRQPLKLAWLLLD